MEGKAEMEINFTEREQLALREISDKQELTDEQTIKQALKMYQMWIGGYATLHVHSDAPGCGVFDD